MFFIKLFCITPERGGRDKYGSCIWCDVHDMYWDNELKRNPEVTIKPIQNIKQIFGHTLQAYYNENRKIVYGDAWEFDNCKMLDTTNAYELNAETFTITKIG